MSAAQIRATNIRSISSPLEIGTCALWFDASDLSTISLSGSSVTQWNDKSGNGRNFSNTTGLRQPTYSATGFNGLYPALTFSGSYLTRTITGTSSSLYTAFLVVDPNNTTLGQYLFDAQTGRFVVGQKEAIGTGVFNGGTWFTVGPAQTGLQIYSFVCTNGGGLFRNGVRFGTIGSFGGLALNNAVSIGSRFSLDSEFYDGEMAEFILFNSALSDGNRQLVEYYLATKWGMLSFLPFNHPGKILPSMSFNNLSGFSPMMIPGSTLWLDAADSSTLTGSTVTTWRDKSGAGNNATSPAGPTQSTYLGYPVVSFNGTSQYMTSANTVPTQTHTLIAVHRPEVLNGFYQGNTSLFRYQISDYVVFPYMFETSPKGYITNFGSTAINFQNSTLLENSITTDLNIIIAVIRSGSQRIFKNGTLQNSATSALTTATTNTLNIGSLGGSSEFYQGSLGEMIVYRYDISDSAREQIEGYLAWKWGLQASLPANHPYRNARIFIPTAVPTSIPLAIKMASSFVPTSISGMILWLDAADPAVFTGGSTWTDKSGTNNTGINGIPGISTMPSVTKWSNGFNAARFVAGSKNSVRTTNTIPNLNVSYFIVARITAAVGYGFFLINNVDGQRQVYMNTTSFPVAVGATCDTITPSLITITSVNQNVPFLYSSTVASGSFPVYSSGNLSGVGSVRTSSSSTHYFGSANGDSGYLSIDVGDIMIYNTVLNTTQRQSVEGYLAWKWGLQANLPANHPFKLFPPPP